MQHLFSALEQTQCARIACDSEWLTVAFSKVFSFFWFTKVVYWLLFGWCMAGATWNCCHLCTSSVYTIQPCTSSQHHFIQSHIGRVHVCLAVTCHLHFWRNDQDLLLATVVTQGCNSYWIKSQHGKLTLRRKLSRHFCRGLELVTF